MSQVLYKKEGHKALIMLNAPEDLNAINLSMVKELAEIWCDVSDDDNIWVAILSGEGKSFCSGANVKKMERGSWQLRDSLLLGDHRLSPSNYGVWKPVIAAVHRHVYGAGLSLALESDIIVASEDALFGIPEGKVNVPTLFAPVISKYLPHSIASELMYTGKPIDAQRAYQLGLVSRVVPKSELSDTAQTIAEQICENGPLSIWATKKLYYQGFNLDYEGILPIIEKIAVPVMNSEDSVEARRAFMEKRKPDWKLR